MTRHARRAARWAALFLFLVTVLTATVVVAKYTKDAVKRELDRVDKILLKTPNTR